MEYTNKQISEIEESVKKRSKTLVHITDKRKFSTEDKIKFGLCQHFVQFKVTHGMTLKKMAGLMDVPTTRLSEITNYKFQTYTVDNLINYLEKLAEHDNQIKEYLHFFSRVAEMRVPTIAQSKKLSKVVDQMMNP